MALSSTAHQTRSVAVMLLAVALQQEEGVDNFALNASTALLALAQAQEAQDATTLELLNDDPDEALRAARRLIVKSHDFVRVAFRQQNMRYFRDRFRMDRRTFYRLVTLLSRDPATLFDPTARNPALFRAPGPGRPQAAVEVQLASFLQLVGGASHVSASALTAVGEGSTYNYSSNVAWALDALADLFVRVPLTPDECAAVEGTFGEKWAGCVGVLDGTLLELANKPGMDAPFYYSGRKKMYGLNYLLMTDGNGRILGYHAGWTAATTDTKVFENSAFWEQRLQLLGEDKFWLADKGYKSTPWTVKPYDEVELAQDPNSRPWREEFNFQLAQERISVEHGIGALKRRFPLLGGRLPGRLPERTWAIVTGLTILLNILRDLGDGDDDPYGDAADDEHEHEEDDEEDLPERMRAEDEATRERIVDELLRPLVDSRAARAAIMAERADMVWLGTPEQMRVQGLQVRERLCDAVIGYP